MIVTGLELPIRCEKIDRDVREDHRRLCFEVRAAGHFEDVARIRIDHRDPGKPRRVLVDLDVAYRRIGDHQLTGLWLIQHWALVKHWRFIDQQVSGHAAIAFLFEKP